MPYLIPGRPVPLQRARHNQYSSRPWDPQKALKQQLSHLIALQNKLKIMYQGPLRLEIIFYFPRSRETRKETWHHMRPDTTNLIKLIEDVCNKLLYEDDCQIAWIDARKMYSSKPRVEFDLHELEPERITDGK